MPSETEVFDEKTRRQGERPRSAVIARGFQRCLHKGKTIEEAADLEFESVFGVGAKRDAKGRPIEHGRGSAAQQTAQHIAAPQKYEGRT
jgi:hypothetical protein